MTKKIVRREPVLSSRPFELRANKTEGRMAKTMKDDVSAWEAELDELAELIRSVEADEAATREIVGTPRPTGEVPPPLPNGSGHERAADVGSLDWDGEPDLDDLIPEPAYLDDGAALEDETVPEHAYAGAHDEDDGEPSIAEEISAESEEPRPEDGKKILRAIDAIEASLNEEDADDYVVRAIDAMESRLGSQVDTVVSRLETSRAELSANVAALNHKVTALTSEIETLKRRTRRLPGRLFSVLMVILTVGAVFAFVSADQPGTQTASLVNETPPGAVAAEQDQGIQPLSDGIADLKTDIQPAQTDAGANWGTKMLAAAGDYYGVAKDFVVATFFSSSASEQQQ